MFTSKNQSYPESIRSDCRMNIKHNKVFITGGTGFIGSHLVDRLVNAKYDVTVLVRRVSNLSFLPLDKITLHNGDLRNYGTLRDGMKGCDAVFHVAALASDWSKKEDFYEINVNGTHNLLNAVKENGIKKVIFVSTTGVLGEENSTMPKPEEAPYKPKMSYFLSKFFESDMNHYRYTKMLAEREAIKFSKKNNLDLIIIRPVWVYGPREFYAGPFEFCKTILNRQRIFPMGMNNKFHVIYVKDVVEAMYVALKKNFTGISIFNIGNEKASNIREYFNLFCKSLDVKPPLYAPFWIFYPASIFLEILAKLFSAEKPYLLTRARVKMFYCNNIYDVSKAKEVLGFKAKTSLEDGIKETVEWWKKNGYLQDKEHSAQKLRQRYILGIEKEFLYLRIAFTVFSKYFISFLKQKISLKQYFFLVKRIILFSKILRSHKIVRIGNVYKIHLYLPAFPSKAFYKAIDKFLILNEGTIPTTVVFSMTKDCGYNCPHCYQKKDGGNDLPIDKLIKVAKDIQNIGVSLFDIEGGEPLLRFDRLIRLVHNIDDRSEIWINTTGHTLTYEKALKLKKAGLFGAMISLHHWVPEKYDKFAGKKNAFMIACSAINIFQRVGINTVINFCPSLEGINESGIEKMMELAKTLNCSFVQIIHEKPAGGWLNRGNTLIDKKLLENLYKKHMDYNEKKKFKAHPSLAMQVFESSSMAFGCTAGGIERFYLNAHGEIQPCEFLNVSFGNVQEEEFRDIYKRMRNKFKKPGLNWLCNTECFSIANYAKRNSVFSLPLKKEVALQLIEEWDKGEEVPLYKRMKLFEKV